MRYVTRDDILQAIPLQTLIWLSNDDPQATEADWDVVNQKVGTSETRVDGFLQGVYRYPLNTDSADLREITLALAARALYARRPEGSSIPKEVVDAAKEAMDLLKQARDGLYQISGQTGLSQPKPASMRIRSRGRVFGDDVLDTM